MLVAFVNIKIVLSPKKMSCCIMFFQKRRKPSNWRIFLIYVWSNLKFPGVNNTGLNSSEYVRRELRTMVNERTMNSARPPQSPIGQNAMMGPNTNANVNNNVNNKPIDTYSNTVTLTQIPNNVVMSIGAQQQQQQQQQMTPNSMMSTSADMAGFFDGGKYWIFLISAYLSPFQTQNDYIFQSLCTYIYNYISIYTVLLFLFECALICYCHHCIVFSLNIILSVYISKYLETRKLHCLPPCHTKTPNPI